MTSALVLEEFQHGIQEVAVVSLFHGAAPELVVHALRDLVCRLPCLRSRHINLRGSLAPSSWPVYAKGDGLIGRAREQSRARPPPSFSLPGQDCCATQSNVLHGSDMPGLRNGPALEVAVVHDHLSEGQPVQLRLY